MAQWVRDFLGPPPSFPTAISHQGPSRQVQTGLQGLVSGYNRAYQQARQANQRRYRQLLDIANQTTTQRAADIRGAYAGREADIMQQLARVGMAGTTVAPTLGLGIEREQQSALNRLADVMQGTKLGIIERRQDQYPDLASLQSIIAGVGSQYGGGQGLSTMLQALSGIKY